MVYKYLFLLFGLFTLSAGYLLVSHSARLYRGIVKALRHLGIPSHYNSLTNSNLMQKSQHNLPGFGKSVVLSLVFLFLMARTDAQNIYLTGTDICSDGTQTTEIGITDSDPDAFYALFRDGERISLRQHNSGTTPNPITFGEFYQAGIYTVVEYADYTKDLKNPADGTKIAGQVHVKPIPELFIQKEPLIVKSGETFKYEPRADLINTNFIWTAAVVEGEVDKFDDRGKGIIELTINLLGEKPAQVVFSIVPVAPDHLGGCMGKPQDVIVNIMPKIQ